VRKRRRRRIWVVRLQRVDDFCDGPRSQRSEHDVDRQSEVEQSLVRDPGEGRKETVLEARACGGIDVERLQVESKKDALHCRERIYTSKMIHEGFHYKRRQCADASCADVGL
jgi:hypothetical protein